MKQTVVVPVTITIDVPDALASAAPVAAVPAGYMPVPGTDPGVIYQQWIAAGKPWKTASGEDVDNRGVPMSWSQDAPWISTKTQADVAESI